MGAHVLIEKLRERRFVTGEIRNEGEKPKDEFLVSHSRIPRTDEGGSKPNIVSEQSNFVIHCSSVYAIPKFLGGQFHRPGVQALEDVELDIGVRLLSDYDESKC